MEDTSLPLNYELNSNIISLTLSLVRYMMCRRLGVNGIMISFEEEK